MSTQAPKADWIVEALAELFRRRQDELDRKITMPTDIGTPRFLHGSCQVFGRLGSAVLDVARRERAPRAAWNRNDCVRPS